MFTRPEREASLEAVITWVVCLAACGWMCLGMAGAETTTDMPETLDDTLPECEFDVHLKPELVCEMQEPDVRAYYRPGQKFCACPPFSECINEVIEHPITMEDEMRFMCYKRPMYADQKHEDMTMGLLREEITVDQHDFHFHE